MRKPAEVAWETAAALPVVATTAYRALALLGLGEGDHTGTTIVIDGAAGAVGRLRGAARGGPRRDRDRQRGRGPPGRACAPSAPRPVVYGEGLADRVRAVAPQGVDLGLRHRRATAGCATSSRSRARPEKAITIADYAGAQELGVTFTSGGDPDDESRALAEALALLADGRLRAPTVVTYPLDEAGKAQDDNQTRRVAGKLVLLP